MEVIVPQFVISSDSTIPDKAVLLSSSIAESTETTWSSASTYALDAIVKYLTTVGNEAGIWKTYKSLSADNIGNNPETTPSKWVSRGATERFKMFDLFTNTKTTDDTDDIVVNLHCNRITSLVFLNVQAASILIEIWKGSTLEDKITANFIGSQEIGLRQKINNWYEYFFSDFEYIRDISTPQALEMYYNTVVQITFSKLSGVDCYVGHCIPGRLYNIGSSLFGASTGIEDYSKIIEDETFGGVYLSQGNYKKEMDLDIRVKNVNINQTNSILTQLRAIPTVWQANQNGTSYDNLLMFGYCKKFKVIMPQAVFSECNLQLRGMI